MTFDVKFEELDTNFKTNFGEVANISAVMYQEICQLVESLLAQVNKLSTVTLYADQWVGADSPYSQVVTIPGTTENSKVNLNPTLEQLEIFRNKDITFVVGNNKGIITVYCIGQKPTNDYTMQAAITEVKII